MNSNILFDILKQFFHLVFRKYRYEIYNVEFIQQTLFNLLPKKVLGKCTLRKFASINFANS